MMKAILISILVILIFTGFCCASKDYTPFLKEVRSLKSGDFLKDEMIVQLAPYLQESNRDWMRYHIEIGGPYGDVFWITVDAKTDQILNIKTNK